jgi:glucokinase
VKKTRPFHIGLDLGGTKIRAAVFNADLHPIGFEKKSTKGHEGARAGLERMKDVVHAAIRSAGLEGRRPASIGVACPGPLDLSRGVILQTPNLGWRNVPVKAVLEKSFKAPVRIANDVDAGVYGEWRCGAARGARSVVGIFPGTGVGGGAVIEGRIVTGRIGSAMEIGHLPMMPDGPLCGCGQHGCLEALASRLAIAGAAGAAMHRGDAPHLVELTGGEMAKIRSGALAESIAAGEKKIEEIVRIAARWIGVAGASMVNLLAPDVLLLGGGLVEAMPKLYREEVERTARGRVMPAFKPGFKVKVASLGDEATTTGAAAWAAEALAERKRRP